MRGKRAAGPYGINAKNQPGEDRAEGILDVSCERCEAPYPPVDEARQALLMLRDRVNACSAV
jgi:hypothetical protein